MVVVLVYFLEIIRPMLVLFVHINILFGCVVFIPSYTQHKLTVMYSINLVVLIESSTCPHGGGIVMTK